MEDLFVNCLSVESILREQGIYSLTSNLNFFLTTNFKVDRSRRLSVWLAYKTIYNPYTASL